MAVDRLARAEEPFVLAIDAGTSSLRASIYDARGEPVAGAAAQATFPLRITAAGAVEAAPDDLVDRVAALLDALAGQAPAAWMRVRGVGTATFWHTLLGVDAQEQALTPLLLWADQRAAAAARALQQALDERAVHARTGCRLHWSYWPAKLRWLADARPTLSRQARRWLSFGEYLYLRLFGEARVSLSMASATGLLDQHTRAWDPTVLAAAAVDPTHLAALDDAPLAGLRRPYAARWPALRSVPWWPAWGDGACSNVGCGALSPRRRALMIGTSGALRAAWQADDVAIPWSAWGYRVDARRVVLGGALNDGGNLLAWLRATLGLDAGADWLPDALEAAVAALPADGHGLTVLPLWAGERSLGWAADARGAIVGLTLATSRAELVRAALEAVALRFAVLDAALAPALAGAAGGAADDTEVIATGGALLRSPVWLQIVADALGHPVIASAVPEASSRGAALLALERLGAIADVEALPAARGATYRPHAARQARYREALARQETLYQLLVAEHGTQFALAGRRAREDMPG